MLVFFGFFYDKNMFLSSKSIKFIAINQWLFYLFKNIKNVKILIYPLDQEKLEWLIECFLCFSLIKEL